ncbi:MAG: restriction endonuclease subunit S [Lachnospiraceae bacterium]|nr:restriction endonuclease subunit S [Lachnospiraceae bacterium]
MDDKRIPKLRFPKFTDEWEQRKFKDIAQRMSNIGTSNEETPSVEYEDVISEQGLLNKDVRQKEEIKMGIKFSENEVLYGKLRPYLHNWLSPNFQGVAVGDWWVLKPINADKNFLYRLIQTPQFDDMANQSSGTKMPRADWKLVSSMKLYIPIDMEEQERIGNYFSNLDNLITLHQRKFDSLKELRDGIIQRIFSRELRFKRLDGREFENWVTKELSEIFTERKVSQTITEDAPLLSFTIEQGVINPQDKKTNKRDFLIKDKDTKKFALTEVDDIIYNPANLKYGAIHRNKLMRGVVSPIYAIFYTEQNPAFMEYVVKNPAFIKNSMKYLEGTVIKLMTLKPRDFLKLKVEVPASLEEQKIIADFLMKFDETIDAEQKKIEKWKELKKGLLQQMFV